MWCQQCQQDVPATRPSEGRPLECSRCQHSLTPSATAAVDVHTVEAVEPSEEWQSEQRLRQIGRSLRRPMLASKSTSDDGDLAMYWREPAHATKRAIATQTAPSRLSASSQTSKQKKSGDSKQRRIEQKRDRRAQSTAWLATVFGLGLALGGAGLMGMGMFGEYPIFWQWGVGVTLVGQAILIAGLVRVLLSLWNNSRNASHRLAGLQAELAEVQRTTEAILAQRPGGSSSFYGELARGASPALLMSNLKGQVDHLAARLHVQ